MGVDRDCTPHLEPVVMLVVVGVDVGAVAVGVAVDSATLDLDCL